jgi:uncharacterized protein (PEP-CTERM system associated)
VVRHLPSEERVLSLRIARTLRLTAAASAFSLCATTAALAEDATTAYQTPPTTVTPTQNVQRPRTTAAANAANAAASTIPPFDWGGTVMVSEAYVSNAGGVSGGSRSDYVSTLGFDAFIHERTARVALDATDAFMADFYAQGTVPTQISNNGLIIGSVAAIPDYLDINARAFASPVVTSGLGFQTAGNRIVPNGFHNSFGYYVEPDLKFRLGDFASSETTATYGSTFFSNPTGTLAVPIPGVPGPEDTNIRSVTQVFSGGQYFERLNWTAIGNFQETKRKQGLLSEKSGIGNLQYFLSHEFSLLGSFGYDAITNTPINNQPTLLHNVSGPVFMGGIGLTFGDNFSLKALAGEKYRSASFLGTLSYCLNPTASIVGEADDYVATPESQLQSGLKSLTSTPNGQINSANNLLCNGSPASLSSYSPQSEGGLSFDQNVARYQTVAFSFLEDFDRNHANLSLYGTRRTILTAVTVGPSKTETWGGRITLSRDITPVLLGTLSGGYFVDQELGGIARNFTADAELNYSLTSEMRIYLQANYLDRHSSPSLNTLSPLTGSLSDYRITLGLSRNL